MPKNISSIERAVALKAFTVLIPQDSGLAATASLIKEIEQIAEQDLDRFGILITLLSRRGLATEMLLGSRYMATFERRLADAAARVGKLSPRTEQNAFAFDQAQTEEIALNNAIAAAIEDANQGIQQILQMAGMEIEEAEALLSLQPGQRLRYEETDPRCAAYKGLIGSGLASNISSHFPGGSLGITLSYAGEVLWRLATGTRKA